MSYSVKLNGKGKFKLSFMEDEIVLDSGKEKITIGFNEIEKIILKPVRRTGHYYFPPLCIIKTKNEKFKITSRGHVYKSITTIFVSKDKDLNLMSNLVHELHKILVEKGLHNGIKFVLGGFLHFSAIFLYPPLVAVPVIVGTKGSLIVTSIIIIIYILIIIAAKTEKYNAVLLAENIRSVSKRLR